MPLISFLIMRRTFVAALSVIPSLVVADTVYLTLPIRYERMIGGLTSLWAGFCSEWVCIYNAPFIVYVKPRPCQKHRRDNTVIIKVATKKELQLHLHQTKHGRLRA